MARQMIEQRQALGAALLADRRCDASVSGRAGRFGLNRLQLLQPQHGVGRRTDVSRQGARRCAMGLIKNAL